MAKTWDERLANLSVKLDELSKKAAEASEDAKVYREQSAEDGEGAPEAEG